MSFNIDEESLRNIVRGVLQQMGGSAAAPAQVSAPAIVGSSALGKGIFNDVNQAAAAAYDGFKQLQAGGFEARKKVIDIVKAMVAAKAREWGTFEYN